MSLYWSLKNFVMLGFLLMRMMGMIKEATSWTNNWTLNRLNTKSSAFPLAMKNQNIIAKRVIIESAITNLRVVLLYVNPPSSSSFSSWWVALEPLSYNSTFTWTKIMNSSPSSTKILRLLAWLVCASFGSWSVRNMKVTPFGISTVQGMIKYKAVTRILVILTTFESSKALNHVWWNIERYLCKSNICTHSKLNAMLNFLYFLYLIKTVIKIWRKKAQILP